VNRLDIRKNAVLNRDEKILTCLLPLGDPDLQTSRKLINIYKESGVDIIELGMPSTNPYLDSQQIADSNHRSFQAHPDYSEYFETMKAIRRDFPDEPFEVMAYSDTVRDIGLERFIGSLSEAGIDGHLLADATVIAPDIVQDMDPLLDPLGIFRIRFMPHPFREDLLLDIGENGRGFVILQSIADTSGERATVAEANQDLINRIRSTETRAAILIAYGINNGKRAEEAVKLDPDGILVGTAMVERIAVGDFDDLARIIRELKAATVPSDNSP
jgi:tryptophan synthase alpha chain